MIRLHYFVPAQNSHLAILYDSFFSLYTDLRIQDISEQLFVIDSNLLLSANTFAIILLLNHKS
jgi:hypothetical protein